MSEETVHQADPPLFAGTVKKRPPRQPEPLDEPFIAQPAQPTSETQEPRKPARTAPENLGGPFVPMSAPEAQEEATGGRKMDPEVRCMSAMLRMIDDLPARAAARVVSWLADRFQEESQE